MARKYAMYKLKRTGFLRPCSLTKWASSLLVRNGALKAHFLSVLAGVSNNFPPSLWNWLLPQTKITINLIWLSNATPNVLTYACLSGPFDYNKMPLAPMGCNVQVHEITNKHGTWAFHLVDRWYLFTSPKHYHTHNSHVENTKSKHLSDTVQFFSGHGGPPTHS